jgi:hypothetical protein
MRAAPDSAFRIDAGFGLINVPKPAALNGQAVERHARALAKQFNQILVLVAQLTFRFHVQKRLDRLEPFNGPRSLADTPRLKQYLGEVIAYCERSTAENGQSITASD